MHGPYAMLEERARTSAFCRSCLSAVSTAGHLPPRNRERNRSELLQKVPRPTRPGEKPGEVLRFFQIARLAPSGANCVVNNRRHGF